MVVYAVVVFAMIPLHEPWRDEAQAWLIARDLDLLGVLRQMRYESSPPLWHLLLWPFAQLGLPYWWAHVLNACIAVGTVAIFSFASPFARWQKVAFVGCFHMAFEYGVVARSYGASMLLGLAVAALHGRRHERRAVYGLLLLALAATNIHAMILAGSLALVFSWELWRRGGRRMLRAPGRRALGTLALLVCGGALLAVTWTFAKDALLLGLHLGFPGLKAAFQTVCFAFFSPQRPSRLLVAMALVVLAVTAWQLRKNLLACVGLALPVSFYIVSPLAYRVSYRHSGFILLAVVIALWTTHSCSSPSAAPASPRTNAGESRLRRFVRASGGPAGILVFGCLAASIPSSIRWLVTDATSLFSASQAMARYIEEQEITAPVAARRGATASALLPYLPGRRFWYADARAWGTFVVWHRSTQARRLAEEELVERIRAEFGDELPWLLTTRPIREPERYGYVLDHTEHDLGKVKRGKEIYSLYRPLGRSGES